MKLQPLFLQRKGLRGLGGLLLLALALGLAGSCLFRSSKGKRVVFIGFDAADWRNLDPLIAQGRLPNFAYLKTHGSWAPMNAVRPYYSPLLWTSIATGRKPEEHGILDFTTIDPETGKRIPITSNHWKVKAIWHIASELGKTSDVIGWIGTWPAERIKGSIISDHVAYHSYVPPEQRANTSTSQHDVSPPEMLEKLQDSLQGPDNLSVDDIQPFFPSTLVSQIPAFGSPKSALDLLWQFKAVYASDLTYQGITRYFLENENFDLLFAFFSGLDGMGHLFMPFDPPPLPGFEPEAAKVFADVMNSYFEMTDRWLGEVLSMLGSEDTLVVCSDHGFKSGAERPPSRMKVRVERAENWHRQFGIVGFYGPGIKEGFEHPPVSIFDIAPTLLALAGIPASKEMSGQVIEDIFEPDRIDPAILQRIPSYEVVPKPKGDDVPLTSSVDMAVLERLHALGYIGGGSGNATQGSQPENAATPNLPEVSDLNARMNLATRYLMERKPDPAIEILEDLTSRMPANLKAQLDLGQAYMMKGDYQRAIDHYQMLLQIFPKEESWPILNDAGILLARLGRYDEALIFLEELYKARPGYAEVAFNLAPIYFRLGDQNRALEIYDQLLKTQPDISSKILKNKAIMLLEMGRNEEAAATMREAAEFDPQDMQLQLSYGQLLEQIGNNAGAIEHYKKTIESLPGTVGAYVRLAVLYTTQQRSDLALNYLEKAHERAPSKELQQLMELARQGKPLVLEK